MGTLIDQNACDYSTWKNLEGHSVEDQPATSSVTSESTPRNVDSFGQATQSSVASQMEICQSGFGISKLFTNQQCSDLQTTITNNRTANDGVAALIEALDGMDNPMGATEGQQAADSSWDSELRDINGAIIRNLHETDRRDILDWALYSAFERELLALKTDL